MPNYLHDPPGSLSSLTIFCNLVKTYGLQLRRKCWHWCY